MEDCEAVYHNSELQNYHTQHEKSKCKPNCMCTTFAHMNRWIYASSTVSWPSGAETKVASEIRRVNHQHQPLTNTDWLETVLFPRGLNILLWCAHFNDPPYTTSESFIHLWFTCVCMLYIWLTKWTHMHTTAYSSCNGLNEQWQATGKTEIHSSTFKVLFCTHNEPFSIWITYPYMYMVTALHELIQIYKYNN